MIHTLYLITTSTMQVTVSNIKLHTALHKSLAPCICMQNSYNINHEGISGAVAHTILRQGFFQLFAQGGGKEEGGGIRLGASMYLCAKHAAN